MAAGLSLPVENIDAFRTAINANTQMTKEEMQTVIHIDVPMPFSYISGGIDRAVGKIRAIWKRQSQAGLRAKKCPHPAKNAYRQTKAVPASDPAGGGWQSLEGLYFGERTVLEEIEGERGCITITYYPQINDFRGRRSLQIVISNVC